MHPARSRVAIRFRLGDVLSLRPVRRPYAGPFTGDGRSLRDLCGVPGIRQRGVARRMARHSVDCMDRDAWAGDRARWRTALGRRFHKSVGIVFDSVRRRTGCSVFRCIGIDFQGRRPPVTFRWSDSDPDDERSWVEQGQSRRPRRCRRDRKLCTANLYWERSCGRSRTCRNVDFRGHPGGLDTRVVVLLFVVLGAASDRAEIGGTPTNQTSRPGSAPAAHSRLAHCPGARSVSNRVF